MARLHHALAALVRRCWAQDPAERPTFADVVGELWAPRAHSVPGQGVPVDGTSGAAGDEPPERFLCVITSDVMRRPVLGKDGHMYEEEVLREWVRRDGTSPMTRAPMAEGDWIVNLPLLQEIEEWRCSRSHPRGGEETAAREPEAKRARREAAQIQACRIDPHAEVNRAVDGDESGRTKLGIAAAHGEIEAVRRLLAAPGIDVNKANKDRETPLSSASSYGYTEVVKLLLAAPGIDVNKAAKYDWTPLSWASYEGHTEVVKLLLAAPGIDVNQAGKNGKTPLYWASYKLGHTEVVKLLLAAPGIDVNQADKNGRTPLAVARKNKEIRALLRAAGACA